MTALKHGASTSTTSNARRVAVKDTNADKAEKKRKEPPRASNSSKANKGEFDVGEWEIDDFQNFLHLAEDDINVLKNTNAPKRASFETDKETYYAIINFEQSFEGQHIMNEPTLHSHFGQRFDALQHFINKAENIGNFVFGMGVGKKKHLT